MVAGDAEGRADVDCPADDSVDVDIAVVSEVKGPVVIWFDVLVERMAEAVVWTTEEVV